MTDNRLTCEHTLFTRQLYLFLYTIGVLIGESIHPYVWITNSHRWVYSTVWVDSINQIKITCKISLASLKVILIPFKYLNEGKVLSGYFGGQILRSAKYELYLSKLHDCMLYLRQYISRKPSVSGLHLTIQNYSTPNIEHNSVFCTVVQ